MTEISLLSGLALFGLWVMAAMLTGGIGILAMPIIVLLLTPAAVIGMINTIPGGEVIVVVVSVIVVAANLTGKDTQLLRNEPLIAKTNKGVERVTGFKGKTRS